nr:monodehydroascorbate reductase [Tanacetum cinerariifolium]
MADMSAPSSQAPAVAPPLDEQWFVLTKDTLREALQITPTNNTQALVAPPSAEVLVDLVNQLGYPRMVKKVSNIVTNDMFQPLRALTTIINLCLTGKTSGFERPRAPVLQILRGIVTQSNINYAKRIWEEFTQSIHTFMEDKRNLSRHTTGKKRATLILIPSIRFTKLIIHHLQRRHKFHPRPNSTLHQANDEPVLRYLKFSSKGTKREVFGIPIPGRLIKEDIREASYYQEYQENVAKHRGFLAGETGSTQDLPAPKPAKPARKPKSTAQKLIQSLQSQLRSSPKSVGASEAEEVPAVEPQVADEESDYQNAVEESLKTIHAVHRGPLPTVVIREPESGKYQPPPEVPGKGKAKVTEEQEESKKVFTGVSEGGNDDVQTGPDPDVQDEGQKETDTDTLDEGQARSNPDERSKGQAGPDPGITGNKEQSIPNPVVHAGSDSEHMDLDVTKASPQPSTEQLDEGFLVTAYPKIQESLKLAVKEQVLLEEPASSSRTISSLHHLSKEAMMVKRIDELEHILADLIQVNKNMEERLDKHRARLYTLEQLDIPQQVSIAVSEVVTDAVDWAMQAPLRNRFRDFLEADMKEILYQRMWETESYKTHKDHSLLFEAFENSMNHDHSEELTQDLAEARKKKRKCHESPKTPPRSPPHQPPPPPPPTGPSGPSEAPGAFGSQVPPPPPPPLPPSTSQDNLDMDEAMGPDEQAQLSYDEDIRSAHIPTVNLRQDWWKPLEEERIATSEPAWSIPSSDAPVILNNWASALASDYSPPPEDSLLLQTGDMATFIEWFCKKRGITELKPQDLEGPAFEIIKVFHPDVIHLQYQMEECHKLLTDSVDNSIPRNNVSKPLPLGGPPGQVTIQSDFFFNKDLEYLRYESKGNRPALSISKMNATYYPTVGLEQMVPDQFWINEECKYYIAAMFKEFKINRMNPRLNTRFWTRKDIDRCKAFMFAIQRHLRLRRIYRNLERFVGGRLREGDYRLLKRTE